MSTETKTDNVINMTMKQQYGYVSLLMLLFVGCGIPSVHPLYESEDLIMDASFTGIWKQDNSSVTWHVLPLLELERVIAAMEDSAGINWTVERPDVMQGDSIVRGEPVLTRNLELDHDGFSGELGFSGGVSSELNFGFNEEMASKLYVIQRQGRNDALFIAGMVELGGNRYLDFHQFRFLEDDPFSFPVHIFMKMSREDEQTILIHYFDENWLTGLITNRQVRIRHEVSRNGNILLTAPTRELKQFVRRHGDIQDAYRNTQTFRRISDVPRFDFESL